MCIFIFSRTFVWNISYPSRSQWPHGLRRGPAAARLLRLWVRTPPVAWIFVCCECCALSSIGFCFGLITRPEESYWLWCVVVCDLETSRRSSSWPSVCRNTTKRRNERDIIIGLHVKCWLFLSDFNDTWIFSTDFRKINIKFHENPSSGSRDVACGRTDRHDETNSRSLRTRLKTKIHCVGKI